MCPVIFARLWSIFSEKSRTELQSSRVYYRSLRLRLCQSSRRIVLFPANDQPEHLILQRHCAMKEISLRSSNACITEYSVYTFHEQLRVVRDTSERAAFDLTACGSLLFPPSSATRRNKERSAGLMRPH